MTLNLFYKTIGVTEQMLFQAWFKHNPCTRSKINTASTGMINQDFINSDYYG